MNNPQSNFLCRPVFSGLGAFISLAIAAVTAGSAAAAPSGFTLTTQTFPAIAHSSVVCGDFNHDGKLDVLLTGSDVSFNAIAQIWQTGASGFLTNLNAGLPGVSSSAVARGDFDNDGRADLLLTGFAGLDANNAPLYLSQVWHNLGNGTFTNLHASLPGVDTGAVALGDLDNDDNLDVVITGYSSTGAVAQVWRNLGNGSFTNLNVGLTGVFYSSVALADFDNDGHLDILLTGTPDGFGSSAITQLWRNLGNGTFTNVSIGLPGVSQGAVAWGDFDLDGRLDILLTGYAQTGAVCQVWRNVGNGTFTNLPLALPGVYQSAVAVADFDNDGQPDFVLAGLDNQSVPICQVWRNSGNLQFTNLAAGLPGCRYGSVAWGDFDNDGRLDLLLSGLDAGGNPMLQIYRNNTVANTAAPPKITSLKSLGLRGQQLTFAGPVGFGYTVWASTNLTQWIALGMANDSSPATFQFSDPSAANLRARYYRVSRP